MHLAVSDAGYQVRRCRGAELAPAASKSTPKGYPRRIPKSAQYVRLESTSSFDIDLHVNGQLKVGIWRAAFLPKASFSLTWYEYVGCVSIDDAKWLASAKDISFS